MKLGSPVRQSLAALGIAGIAGNGIGNSGYRAELQTEAIRAGEEAPLVLRIADGNGQPATSLRLTHEKLVHMILVSSDLSEFAHLHPEQTAPGVFMTTYVFPSAGKYLLYADFAPPSGDVQVERFEFHVNGSVRPQIPLEQESSASPSVETAGVRVQLNRSRFTVGDQNTLRFSVFDSSSGLPAQDLQPYLGEAGHFVIISEDGSDFVHAHPLAHHTETHKGHDAPAHHGGHKTETRLPGEVEVAVVFPRSGLYKIWAQFQRRDTIIVSPFVVVAAE